MTASLDASMSSGIVFGKQLSGVIKGFIMPLPFLFFVFCLAAIWMY
jgi:hypothetical protein